jgi:four helix bundle protein
MGTPLEDLRILQEAEVVADGVWGHVARWEPFARQVVGGQLARAADFVGANIAEAFGRYHYRDKIQFLTSSGQETGINLFSDAELEWLETASISNL